MTCVLPQCARDIFVFVRGVSASVCPVHANSAFLCAIIQSTLPSRCTTTKLVFVDRVAMSAV